MKYLITFEKAESVRWLGHLDILRTFERAIRRAELPIAFTAGFNPRERIAFANALSVGITASQEPATLELIESVPPSDLVARLNEKLPPGIQLKSAIEIPDAGSRDLLNSYDRAEFYVTCVCDDSVDMDSAQSAADALMEKDDLTVEREREGKVKRLNIRPFTHDVRALERTEGRISFAMTLGIGMDGVAKPQEIVACLANDLSGLAVRRVHRARLLAREAAASGV